MSQRSTYPVGQTVRYWPTPYDDVEDDSARVGWISTVQWFDGHLEYKIMSGENYEWVDAASIIEIVDLPDLSTTERIVEFLSVSG